MNTIYSTFNNEYETLTGGKKREESQKLLLDLLLKNHPSKKVLDIACGTGLHARLLAEAGLHVTAVDNSEAMLSQARKLTGGASSINWYNQEMGSLNKSLDDSYDLILCLGNSIPHLINKSLLIEALVQMYNLINDSGLVIVQLLNYNRILSDKERIVAITRSEKREYIRFYDYQENGLLQFNVLAIDWSNNTPEHTLASIQLKPWTKEDIMSGLMEAGFKKVNVFGEIDESPFTDESETYAVFAVK